MRSTLPGISAIALTALALAGPVHADVAMLVADRDATLYESTNGTVANGSGEHVFAGETQSQKLRRALLHFDLSTIPPGSTIDGATLRLYMSRTTGTARDIALHRVLADWGEGASNPTDEEGGGTSAEPGDATWLHTFYDTTFWSSQGGDFVSIASATATVGDIGYYAWSGSGMVADVQNWLDGAANDGWLLAGVETTRRTTKRFDSRTNPVSGQRPQLTILYTPPAIDGACCVDLTCVIAGPSACSSAGGVYQGDATTCSPDPCTVQLGACCHDNGSCSEETQLDCGALGGAFQGEGSNCATSECPVVLEPFVDALPIPAVATPDSGLPGSAATYTVSMTEFQQQLHRDLPPTTLWGYGGSFPGPTIEARRDDPVIVDWINDLRDVSTGQPRVDHYLPVDGTVPVGCIHGAQDLPKTVVHLHGAHTLAEYDGYPEDTFLPGADALYVYPNHQLAGTLWYHDHALGITRLNVYMGLAGFYLIRDDVEDALDLPAGEFEIPLVIQDRSFNPDGTLKYPALWQEHFFGDSILVNGKVWPYLDVKRGAYRFRILNGSGSRTYRLSLSDAAVPFHVIGTAGGLLPEPVPVTSITLGPAERSDVVIDFSALAPGTEVLLTNDAPAPFPGTPGIGVVPDVMKLVVGSETGHTSPLPAELRPLERLQEADAVQTRDFELYKSNDPCTGSRWTINGLSWEDVTEFPELGTIEVWRFINESGISHPMHMHLVNFQILDRQPFEIVGNQIVTTGPPVAPAPEEAGWKDTAMSPPFEITRVIARFEDYTGLFAYHCHILEHEDHEMMRQFQAVSCGNADLEPTEQCDDGGAASGDGCSAGCDLETFIALSGSAVGGTVQVVVAGVTIGVTTVPGQTAAEVLQGLVDAILADPTLQAAGVQASTDGRRLIVDASIDGLTVGDAGLDDLLWLAVEPELAWWGRTEGSTGYDVAAGDLGTLRSTAGDFAAATTGCLADDVTAPSLALSASPAPGQGLWFVVRDVVGGLAGSYDSGGAGQGASRDPGITACP